MRQLLNSLYHSKFARNVLIVASGTAGAQAITIVFTPIVTRLYSPEIFGVVSTFIAVLSVLAPITAFSYPLAIVLPEDDLDALAILKLSIVSSAIVSLLTFMLILCFGDIIINALNIHSLNSIILLLPVAMLVATVLEIGNQWIIRERLFKLKAQASIIQSICLNLSKISIGILVPSAAGLALTTVIGNAINVAILIRGANGKIYSRCKSKKLDINKVFKNYKDFMYYRTPQIMLNSASQSMPVLMLGSFVGPAAAGSYALGKMLLSVPTTLIGQSVTTVFYPKINEAVQKGENASILLAKATLVLAVVGIIPFSIIGFFGPQIFSLVFGEEWYTAGVYAQWLSLWSYFGFMNRPSVGAIPVFKLQSFFLYYEIISTSLRAIVLLIGFIVFESELNTIILFSVISALLNFLLIFATFISSRKLS